MWKRSASLVLAKHHINSLQLAEPSFADHLDRQAESMIAPLPRSDLYDAPRFLDDLPKPFAFVDGQGEWFLAIHILAGAACVHHHLRVPMVRRADRDDIDLLQSQEISIIFKVARSATKGRFHRIANVLVDVTDSHDVTEHGGLVGDDAALVAQTYSPNSQPLDLVPWFDFDGRCS